MVIGRGHRVAECLRQFRGEEGGGGGRDGGENRGEGQ